VTYHNTAVIVFSNLNPTLYGEYRVYMREGGIATHTKCLMQYGGLVLQIMRDLSLEK
jgi:hypothetical protein